jgi:CO/xanthine dehydrogenase Mo-binding subunit
LKHGLAIDDSGLLGEQRELPMIDEKSFTIVGTSVNRVDGVAKVTGAAKFAADFVIPGMVEGKLLRSPHAHARIARIDTREAEKVPGVITVLTGQG